MEAVAIEDGVIKNPKWGVYRLGIDARWVQVSIADISVDFLNSSLAYG